jgi:transcription antitermination factor NusG
LILEYPGVNPITTDQWFMLELRSEKTSEETIKRIGKAMKDIFQEDAAEVFIPVIQRDLDTFVLLTECYVFVRADNPLKVGKLKRVTGVQGVLAKDESTRHTKFLRVPDDYVQGLIKQCWDAHYKRAQTIKVGSWVRILDGQTRDYCGLVMAVDGDLAMVRIDKKTKMVSVQTPVHNLLDLSHVPDAHRVFYYSEPVKAFLEEMGIEAETAIHDDRAFDEDALKAFLGPDEEESPMSTERGTAALKHHTSREQTPTRFVKGLILQGEKDVKVLLTKTVEAIRGKVIKSPKTATILWHVIRETVVATMFGDDTRIKTYSDILNHHGKTFDLTPSDVLKAIPELPLRQLKPGDAVVIVPAPIIEIPKDTTATVTSIIRAALVAKNYDLMALMAPMADRILSGDIRAPKHLDSFTQAIRTQVLKHFKATHTGHDIKALAELFSPSLHITAVFLREHHPSLEQTILDQRAKQFKPIVGIKVTKQVEGIIPKKPTPVLIKGVTAVRQMPDAPAPKPRLTQVIGKTVKLAPKPKPRAKKAKKPTPEPVTGTV